MEANTVLLANGNLRIKRTPLGLMVYNINDMYVGRSFDCYGEFSRHEKELFAQLVTPDSLVVDVGANIGGHTLFFARAVGPGGTVLAIEPQRAVYQLLCANLALNEINNVRAICAAAGATRGHAFVPICDYAKLGNFGGIELGDKQGDPVEVVSIDSLQILGCQFMKIDVEGHESQVITGAAHTIAKFRPILYVENDRRHRSADLIRQICDLDYTAYWHLPPLYSADNFYHNPTNVFPGIVSLNMLCFPSNDARTLKGLKRVAGPGDWPLPD
jgi:FkbM family methyltransferase